MFTNTPSSNEPFWMDEPNPYPRPKAEKVYNGFPIGWSLKLGVRLIEVCAAVFFLSIALAPVKIFLFPIGWFFVAFQVCILLMVYFLWRSNRTNYARAIHIQELAKERTGAEYLGSAIHTAGHPLLQVNQPVVLALKGSELSIYSYESPVPLDNIRLDEIQAVDLVVFDDENIPHTNVIDNTAQALQISFQRNGMTFLCAFRRMVKMRSIGWYQAIQKARLMEKAG
jgi:hypothetical protein